MHLPQSNPRSAGRFCLWALPASILTLYVSRDLYAFRRPQWPSSKVSTSDLEGFQVRNPSSLKIRRVLGCYTLNHTQGDKRPPAGVVWRFGDRSAS
ncbi:hypothetical protein AVEN_98330-1 [Araneus ventricosus]|uniref:Uncharacterized protein n=1 Tax=Araneus ventricosus TaxID=182803 RepID=A0A4Y2QV14_ARAVE|nr:hypothetical protein AVEN_98330-1 [Araneus ventricosus]